MFVPTHNFGLPKSGWRMKLRDKLPKSAIAKFTGSYRNTVKKWIKAPGDNLEAVPIYRASCMLTPMVRAHLHHRNDDIFAPENWLMNR